MSLNLRNNLLSTIISNIENVIFGKRQEIELVIIALLAKGHVLIEDMPGVGKTTLVGALAKSFDCSFSRIQFTADILPSDITGFTMYNQATAQFDFKKGAVMSQFVLADEINRTSPKTQASLLEVMEENQVTVDGQTYPVPAPFMVLATQNPVEYVGTFPLPEAQLDRFLMKLSLGYPSVQDETEMLYRYRESNPLTKLASVATAQDILKFQDMVEKIHVDTILNRYIVELIAQSRNNDYLLLGASPRASLCLMRSAQAHAFFEGRDYVRPQDIKAMAVPVLSHRLKLKQEAKVNKITQQQIVNQLLQTVPVPLFGSNR